EASKRIDAELAFAKDIQHSALPNVFPAYPDVKEFDIYATMATAKEVGGDFYDFYLLPDNRLAFLIADVSGKGIPAAMFMMQSKTLLKNLTESGLPLSDVFTVANRELSINNEKGMFVTAWLGILDYKTGEVEYVNAGHNPPMVYRRGKGFEKLNGKAGFVLAGLEGYKYKSQTLKLEAGDRIFLYTDGVTEATVNDSLYGEERLLNYLNSHVDLGAEKMLTGVKKDVDKFTQGAEQFDDITMLMLDNNGAFNSETKVFPAKEECLPQVLEFVVDETDGLTEKLRRVLSVAIEEIFVNVAHYAYGEKTGDVEIKKETSDGCLAVTFTDSGVEFNQLLKDDPDITESVEERKIGGLGIFIVKKSMDRVTYEYKDGKNVLTVMKKI
ncbi:MAG: SpoIIE family protein phosphatase, partial [Clostridia bacterium]|nr:SpoIIE family protein phosphatase [Clostridia bacterium]